MTIRGRRRRTGDTGAAGRTGAAGETRAAGETGPEAAGPVAATWLRRPGATGSTAAAAAGVGAAGLALTNLLVLTGAVSPLRAVITLPVAVLLPGGLAARALRLPDRPGWPWLLHAVALSLAGLLAVSLTLGLLPGAALSTTGCLLGLDVLVGVLAVAAALATGRRDGAATAPARGRQVPATARDGAPAGRWTTTLGAAAVTLGAAAVTLAVAGARVLTAGGGPALAVAGLTCAAAALAGAAAAARAGARAAAATALYLLGLAVLLATSLRGAGVTGHDIKIEYRVFSDTLASGSWHPGGFNISYNSCLSITVLPAFLAKLLGIAAPDVFRVCFQVLFATVPVGVFLIASRVLASGQAMLAAGLFVAFPTFVNDMTMLNRQEIALVFFVVAIPTVLDSSRSPRWYLLFAVLGAGLTVSHYSSTYLAATMILLAWLLLRLHHAVARAGRRLVPSRRRLDRPGLRQRRSAAAGLGLPAAILIALPAGWAAVTGVDAVLLAKIHRAIAAVTTDAPVDADSTAYSLVGGSGRQTDEDLLGRYSADLRRRNAPLGAPAAGPGCAVRLLPADVLPRTPLGAALARIGIAPAALNAAARTCAVVLFQGGAVLGTGLLAWRQRARPPPGPPAGPGTDRPAAMAVLAAFGVAATMLLAGTVVAPQLSDDYGPLRMFQQSLTVLAAAVVLAVAAAARRLPAAVAATAPAAVALGCLLTTSGVLPELTGDFPPQLNLNNAGNYYRAYYLTPADIRAAQWAGNRFEAGQAVVADGHDSINLDALTRLAPRSGLVPGTVPATEPVEITTPDGQVAVATAMAGDRVLRYSFPLSCVAARRPLLHTEGIHRIYGPVVS